MKNNLSIHQLLAVFLLLLIAVGVTAQESEHSLDMIMDIGCAKCHQQGADDPAYRSVSSSVCEQCHDIGAGPDWVGQVFHNQSNRNCAECHSFHDTTMLHGGGVDFKHVAGAAQVQLHCRTCHDVDRNAANVSPGHRNAVSVYHVESVELASLTLSEACQRCHDGGVNGSPYINSHASHPVGVRVPLGRGRVGSRFASYLPDNVETFTGRMECQTCHLMTGEQAYLLQEFDAPELLCDSCHKMGVKKYDPFQVADIRPNQLRDRR
jgi:hypothetical protein